MCNGIGINLISTLIGTITGAIIGAGASIYATKVTVKSQFDLLDKKEEKESQAAVRAIVTELHALKDILDIEINPKMSEPSLSFDYQYSNISDYFSILNSNLDKIGKISDKELRENIVQIYVKIKYFLDCIKTNNEMFGQEAILFKMNCLIPTYNEILNLFNELEELENKRG